MSKYRKRMLLWCVPITACGCGVAVAHHFGNNLAWAACLAGWLASIVMWAYNLVMFWRER